ncbi:hypothetical protein Pmani_021797 [Petrolisthes manimaculis]|uniref:Uncharacterized protein n=1 Tax=Petrolisthes manimaculis TaxID=1843537 RepID=A0AAE1U1B3_9EUCA|nr:hypothetical protein Pmani_021797 [Petrolisthes manimaculis]
MEATQLILEDPEATLFTSLADDARFFVYSYNSSTLILTVGLTLGLFFVITALALYVFYFATNGRRRTDRSWEGGEGAKSDYDEDDPTLNLTSTVLDLLEKAWLAYGVKEEACRRRVACEAYMLAAIGVDKPEATILTQVLGQVTEDDLTRVTSTRAEAVRDILHAANYGHEFKNCQHYATHCPFTSLATPVHK